MFGSVLLKFAIRERQRSSALIGESFNSNAPPRFLLFGFARGRDAQKPFANLFAGRLSAEDNGSKWVWPRPKVAATLRIWVGFVLQRARENSDQKDARCADCSLFTKQRLHNGVFSRTFFPTHLTSRKRNDIVPQLVDSSGASFFLRSEKCVSKIKLALQN